MQQNLSNGCKPDGSGCPTGALSTPVPLVTSGILSSTFVNSSTSITDLQQNAAGNFAGRIEQNTLNAHLRPNQQFSSIIFISNLADSVYHSWQTTVRKRFAAGFLMNFSYTFGKAIDDQSGDPVATSYNPTTSTVSDSHNLRRDRGPAAFDQKHVTTMTWVYELPFGKGKPFLKSDPRLVQGVLGGWSLQGFNSYMSGEPFSVTSGAKTYQYGVNGRAVVVGSALPSGSLQPGALGPVFFRDTRSFALAAPGTTGMGGNMSRGPAVWDSDAPHS